MALSPSSSTVSTSFWSLLLIGEALLTFSVGELDKGGHYLVLNSGQRAGHGAQQVGEKTPQTEASRSGTSLRPALMLGPRGMRSIRMPSSYTKLYTQFYKGKF